MNTIKINVIQIELPTEDAANLERVLAAYSSLEKTGTTEIKQALTVQETPAPIVPATKTTLKIVEEPKPINNVAKVTWTIGLNNLEDGTKLFIHPKLDGNDNAGIEATNNKGYWMKKESTGVIHVYPNLSRCKREQNLTNTTYQHFSTGAYNYKNGWERIKPFSYITPYDKESCTVNAS